MFEFFFKSPQERVAKRISKIAPDLYRDTKRIVKLARNNSSQAELRMVLPLWLLDLNSWYVKNSKYDPTKTLLAPHIELAKEYGGYIMRGEPVPHEIEVAINHCAKDFSETCNTMKSDEDAIGSIIQIMASNCDMSLQSKENR